MMMMIDDDDDDDDCNFVGDAFSSLLPQANATCHTCYCVIDVTVNIHVIVSCTCVSHTSQANATVSYIGFDCFTPDPLHIFDPLE